MVYKQKIKHLFLDGGRKNGCRANRSPLPPLHLAPPPGPWGCVPFGCIWMLVAMALSPDDGAAHPFRTLHTAPEGKQNKPPCYKPRINGGGATALMCTCPWPVPWAAGQGQYRPWDEQQVPFPPVRLPCLFPAIVLSGHIQDGCRPQPLSLGRIFRNPLLWGWGGLGCPWLPQQLSSSPDSWHSCFMGDVGPEVWGVLPFPGLSLPALIFSGMVGNSRLAQVCLPTRL